MYKVGAILFIVGVLGLVILFDIAIFVKSGLTAVLVAIFLEMIFGGLILIFNYD